MRHAGGGERVCRVATCRHHRFSVARSAAHLGKLVRIAECSDRRRCHVGVETDLSPVKAALVELTDAELRALCAATYEAPQVAPGLLAWLEHAADWELHRRNGLDFRLQPPEAAIPPEEDAVTIDAAMAMRATFAQDDRAEEGGVLALSYNRTASRNSKVWGGM